MPRNLIADASCLRGRVAVVTGGSSGIGLTTCAALLSEGVSIVLVGRDPEHVQHAVDSLQHEIRDGSALGLVADVRKEEDTERMVAHTMKHFGTIDILVACAGTGTPAKMVAGKSSARLSVEDWDLVLDTNLKGLFLCAKAVVPRMIERRRGEIISIASARGSRRGLPFAAAYCASKFGVIGLSQSLAEEVRDYGIRVQTLLPDVTDTKLLQQTSMAGGLGALLSPADVAEFIVHMLKLPPDAVLDRPLLAPHATPGTRGHGTN